MPGPPSHITLYKDLVEFVLGQHKDLVSLERLNLFLGKSKKKFPALNLITITEDFHLGFSEDFYSDEDAALRSLSVVIACAYKVLEMFVGTGTARDRILATVDKFKADHLELDSPELRKYLPKREQVEKGGDTGEPAPKLPKGDGEGAGEGPEDGEVTEEDILKPKDEGLPFYDEEKKEWVIKPASEVKRLKEAHTAKPVPGFESYLGPQVEPPKKKVDDLPPDPLLWIQEEFDYGRCIVVEGTGQEKNMLCAEFLKEGLEAGDDIIAVLGYPAKVFTAQMQKLGIAEKELANIHIIDWHTFKERQVLTTEVTGNVHVVPKDPKFMGSALTSILTQSDKGKRKRAFVSFISYALTFIDFETVYNLVQVTRLKFRKSKVMGLFTMEAGQHAKDQRDPFMEIADGLIKIKEGMSGANTWKMKADVQLKPKDRRSLKDVVIMRSGIVVLERKPGAKEDALGLGIDEPVEEEVEDTTVGEKGPEEQGAVAIDQYLIDKVEMWRGLGFNVGPLEEAMSKSEDTVKEALVAFERKAGKALELRGRIDDLSNKVRSLRDQLLEDEALDIRRGLKDLEDLQKIEGRINALENTTRERYEKESKRRDREKDIFRIRMEHWARQGYDVSKLEHIMDKDLETVNREFAIFRTIVNRLKNMEEELDRMALKGHELDIQAIRKRLFDVEQVDDTERMFARIRESVIVKERIMETAKSRRNELMDEMFNWALEGYCVDLIDRVDLFREDLSSLEERMNMLRTRIERLKKMEQALNGMDLTAHRDEEGRIRDMIKNVEKVEEVEKRVTALQETLKGKISGDVAAVEENLQKVKELEETWQKLKARLLAENRGTSKDDKKA